MLLSTRIAFSTKLDFLTWLLEREEMSVPPFKPLHLSEQSQPSITLDRWLTLFKQACLEGSITDYLHRQAAENFYQPLGFSNSTLKQLLLEYELIGNARVFHFLSYTEEKDGHLGGMLKLWSLFKPMKVETVSLIHWHQPIHYLHDRALVVGTDLSDYDFEGMAVYLQTLANDPRFRREHVGRFVSVRTRMTDLAILKQALQQLGLTVLENEDARASQIFMPCNLVAKLAGDYDIGWKITDQGTLEMYWDVIGIDLTQDALQLVSAINQQYLRLQVT